MILKQTSRFRREGNDAFGAKTACCAKMSLRTADKCPVLDLGDPRAATWHSEKRYFRPIAFNMRLTFRQVF